MSYSYLLKDKTGNMHETLDQEGDPDFYYSEGLINIGAATVENVFIFRQGFDNTTETVAFVRYVEDIGRKFISGHLILKPNFMMNEFFLLVDSLKLPKKTLKSLRKAKPTYEHFDLTYGFQFYALKYDSTGYSGLERYPLFPDEEKSDDANAERYKDYIDFVSELFQEARKFAPTA